MEPPVLRGVEAEVAIVVGEPAIVEWKFSAGRGVRRVELRVQVACPPGEVGPLAGGENRRVEAGVAFAFRSNSAWHALVPRT